MPAIPFLILLLPILEIATFVIVGSEIGVLATIGLVVASTIAGGFLLRVQGFGALARIRATMEGGGDPGRDLVDALMIMLAGILLVIPGFLTDAIGILLFLPPVRRLAWKLVLERVVVVGAPGGFGNWPGRRRDRTIDLDSDDFTRRRPAESPPRTIDHDS